MTDVLFYILAFVLMGVGYVVLKRNARQKAAERSPTRLAEAAGRGWTYQYDQTPLFEIERWRGATDGIEWVGEAARSGMRRTLSHTGAGRATGESVTHVTRWSTKRPILVSGPVLLLHQEDAAKQDEIAKAVADAGPLARKLIDKALDIGLAVRFGKAIGERVDSQSLKAAVLPATGYDGYSLMAADPSEASALLFQRLGPALTQARAVVAPDSLSILITPEGLAVSVPRWTFKTDELVPIMNAGLTLAKALR